MSASSMTLTNARNQKSDEFYTRIQDIEKELELHSSRILSAYNSKSDEEKQAIVEKMLKTRSEWSDEKREQVRKKQRESKLNMTQEARQQRKICYR